MAKLARKKQKIFGSTGDVSQFGQIGSDAAGTPTTTKDIDTIQSLAQYLSGLYSITENLNAPPRGQDMNALYHLITRQLAYLFESGVPEWEASTEYSSLTSLVLHGGNVWLSLSNSNIGNTPALGSAHWRKVIDQYGTAQESVSTVSRIFDLTGDRVPAIPDDPVGVTYRSNFATTDGWAAYGGASLSVSDGKLIATKTGSAGTISLIRNMTYQSKLCVLTVQSDDTETILIRGLVAGVETTLRTVNVRAGVMEYIPFFNTFNATYFAVASTGPGAVTKDVGDRIILGFVYIGTGTYLSKLIDRAGVPWTNYGALPVNGPFGKGLQFNGAQYLQAPGPMIGATGTIAFSVRLDEDRTCNIISNYNNVSQRGVFIQRIASAGSVSFCLFDGPGTTQVINNSEVSLLAGEHSVFVFSYNGTTVKGYKNGVLKFEAAQTISFVSNNNLRVGTHSDGGNYFTGTIYAIRADSRVWTDDEIARWSRDPYSEESIPMSSTPAANALVQWPAGGNFGAGSKLDADTVDGVEASRIIFGESASGSVVATDANAIIKAGFYMMSPGGANMPSNLYYNIYHFARADSTSGSHSQIAISIDNDADVYVRRCSNGTWGSWRKIWNEGNVGTNWPAALAAALGTGWTTALAAAVNPGGRSLLGLSALGSGWTTALAAALGSGWATVFAGADPLLSLYGITGPGDYIIPGWGDGVLAYHLAGGEPEWQTTSTTFLETPDGYKVSFTGNIRARFSMRLTNSTATVYGRIYINGVGVGTEHSLTGLEGGARLFFFTDISVSKGDLVECRIRTNGSGGNRSCFALCGNGAGRKYQIVI